jgi:Tol biopolymer transport system component
VNPVLGAVISPDGKYLAFADKTGFYLRQIDSGETHPLNFPSEFHAVPAAWYPDGNHLVAVWAEGPTTPSSLWQVSIMGGTPRKLIDDGQLPSVSPDGSQIAFVKGSKEAEEMSVMAANGEKPRQLVACRLCTFGTPAWSPEGRRVAYVTSSWFGHDWKVDSSITLFDLASGRQETIFSALNGHGVVAPWPTSLTTPGPEMGLGPALVWTSDNRLICSISEPPPSQDDSNVWSVPLDSRGHIAGTAVRLTATPDKVASISAGADAKRISFTKTYLIPGIYISDVNSGGGRLNPPRRLTLDSWRNYPFAWTADSKAVLFSSDRDGTFHIFKQQVDQSVPELLVGGDEETSLPRLAPDDSTILFEIWPKVGAAQSLRRVMRVPVSGGPPQPVLEHAYLGNMQCARPPSSLCLYDLRSSTQVSFFRFDPATGKSKELHKAGIQDEDSYAYNWTLSPDGKILAAAKGKVVQRAPQITFISLEDGSRHTVTAQAWAGINSIDFSADGRSVWASSHTNTGKWALLNIDLQGRTRTALEDAQMTIGWAIPSPDGKHLAFWKARGTSNVWMLEGF